MQSISRMIKRHNAVIAYNSLRQEPEIIVLKKSERGYRAWAVRNAMTDMQQSYCDMVTRPLTKAFIDKEVSERKRYIYDN